MQREQWIEQSILMVIISFGVWPGCNEHPISPLDKVVVSTQSQSHILPPKTKIDFLFVIDSSGSMAEEQQNLRENFSAFSHFLFDELGVNADYRIAVTNMDDNAAGRFLIGSEEQGANGNTLGLGQCAQLSQRGELSNLLKSEDVQNKADLEVKFGCMSALGIRDSGIESGLESMRKALSCNGPNADKFGVCCVPDPRGEGTSRFIYNPSCDPGAETGLEPEFLRPDALLVVVIISDENDCSMPILNEAESNRPICAQNMNQMPADFMPLGYQEQTHCAGLSPQACYRRDCGDLGPHDCYATRCDPELEVESSCEWNRHALTDVADYSRFLESLKANPGEQVLVATIVGQQAYTPMGKSIYYSDGAAGINPLCIPLGDPFPLNYEIVQSDECCPEGHCQGERVISCSSLGNGIAYSGTRYLEMAEAFGSNSISCPPLKADTVQSPQLDACDGLSRDQGCHWMEQGVPTTGKCRPIVDLGTLACAQCTSICEDSFQESLQQIKNKVSEALGTYCLKKRPVCTVEALDGSRLCDSPEEHRNPENYLSSIRVTTRCTTTVEAGGDCEAYETDQVLQPPAWSVELASEVCGGGSLVRLQRLPSAGSEVSIEYYASTQVQ